MIFALACAACAFITIVGAALAAHEWQAHQRRVEEYAKQWIEDEELD